MKQQILFRMNEGDYWAKRRLGRLLKRGYRISSSHSINRGWNLGKTIGLGLVFLPLALGGKRATQIEYILDYQEPL